LVPIWADTSKTLCATAIKPMSSEEDKNTTIFAFPENLQQGTKLTPRRITTFGSCRIQASAPDTKASTELTCMLLEHLHAMYMVSYSPGLAPVRTKSDATHAKGKTSTAILYGNSNIRQCVPALQALGYSVVDRTCIHWDGSDRSIEQISQDVAAHTGADHCCFVFDLLGPSAYRFEQSDGSLAMPVKIGGGFHLLGEANIADESMIKTFIGRVGPLLTKMAVKPTVLIPPPPSLCLRRLLQAAWPCSRFRIRKVRKKNDR